MAHIVEWAAYKDAVRAYAQHETAKFRLGPAGSMGGQVRDFPHPYSPPRSEGASGNPMAGSPRPPMPPVPPVVPPDMSGRFLRRAQGIALVIVAAGLAAAMVIWAQRQMATPVVVEHSAPPVATARPLPTNERPPPTSQPEAPQSEAVVVNFVRFSTRQIDGLSVVTGWKWADSRQDVPVHQHCYVNFPDPQGGAPRMPIIATDRSPKGYDAATMLPLTEAEYNKALTGCSWFENQTSETPVQRRTTPSGNSESKKNRSEIIGAAR